MDELMHHFCGFKSKTGLGRIGIHLITIRPMLFFLRGKDQKAEGILGVHVDDGLCCGSEVFHKKLALLEKKFPFGSKKHREFTFTGLKSHNKRISPFGLARNSISKT
jgi:hypothetical protein